jgi:DNA/RNA-binding domain of Phe-tRNA-synthetase-like protein
MEIELEFARDERLRKLKLAMVTLEGLNWHAAASSSTRTCAAESIEFARQKHADEWDVRIKAIRELLRNGKYKPAGRAKPSSEYLRAAALEETFPHVNPFVDVVNCVSLKYMYPMSIFDADRAGADLVCRLGVFGERYVFNSAGQEIDLEDLICICARSLSSGQAQPSLGEEFQAIDGFPIVNPVRDSMATKLFEGAKNAVVAIYAPRGPEDADLVSAANDLVSWCGDACRQTEIRFYSLP